MGRIAGIRIKNYGSLKDIKMGKLLFDSKEKELTNINAIIGQSGTGKSTLADAFGFLSDRRKRKITPETGERTIWSSNVIFIP